MKRFGVLVATVVLATVLGACGDDDDKTSTAEPTKAQYVEQANAACKRTTDNLTSVFEEGFPVVRSQIPDFVRKASPVITKGMTELRAVEVPKAEQANAEPLRKQAEEVGARWAKALTDEAEGAKLFNEEGGFEGIREAAKSYGLSECEKIGDEDEGEGEEQTPVDPATFSAEKKAYIEKVDAVCKVTDVEDDKIEEEVFGEGFPPTIEQWASGLPRFSALSKQRSAEIKKVTAPAAEKAQIDAILAKEATIVVELDKAAKLAQSGNEQELQLALNTLFPQFDELDAELRAFGFAVCGSSDDEE